MDDAEVEGIEEPDCPSTASSSEILGTSEEASSPTRSLSGPGEVEEERDVVEEVVDEEECGEVSEKEAGGGKECVSDGLSPPADVEAADVEPEAAPPPIDVPLLYS